MDVWNRSRFRLPEPVLELGEDLLDRVEVRAVGRQEEAVGADGADRLPDSFALVAAEVVEDDDIAGPEGGSQELLHIGAEALAVDRSVEDAGRVDPIDPEGSEEGERAPAAMRRLADQAFAARPPAPERGHIGLGPGLVDEDEPPRVDRRLPGAPSGAAARDVGAVLFTGERGFF